MPALSHAMQHKIFYQQLWETDFQGESNMHQIVVTVLCHLHPPFPWDELPLFWYRKTQLSAGSPTISTGSSLLSLEIGGKRWREMVALNSVNVWFSLRFLCRQRSYPRLALVHGWLFPGKIPDAQKGTNRDRQAKSRNPFEPPLYQPLIYWDVFCLLTVEVFLLTVRLFYLWCGNRNRKAKANFRPFAYGWTSVGSVLLAVENRFGLLTYGSQRRPSRISTASKTDPTEAQP